MKKAILITVSIIVVFVLTLFLIRYWTIPRDENPIFHPLPAHTLKTPSGESVQIPAAYPDQDYLLLFFIDSSPTSLTQLAELSRAADTMPERLALIAIHPGRMSGNLPPSLSKRIHLLLDLDASFTRSMEIRTVPTLYLLTHEFRQLAFAESLVPAATLATYPALLPETQP